MNAESQRLQEARDSKEPWKKWGPYLSERQWGWTGVIARALHLFATLTPEQLLEGGAKAYSRKASA